MNPRKRRSRIVSFRLSDEEYDFLKKISESHGARNVSEFTRSAAFNIGEDSNGDSVELEEILAQLREAVETLSTSTRNLTSVLKQAKGIESNATAPNRTIEESTEWQPS